MDLHSCFSIFVQVVYLRRYQNTNDYQYYFSNVIQRIFTEFTRPVLAGGFSVRSCCLIFPKIFILGVKFSGLMVFLPLTSFYHNPLYIFRSTFSHSRIFFSSQMANPFVQLYEVTYLQI